METFGNKIKAMRTKAKLTQGELAEILGISQQSVSLWERNEYFPSRITIVKLSNYFNVSVDSLINDEPMSKETVLSKDEKTLLRTFNLLDKDNQQVILNNIDFLLYRQYEAK